MSVEDEQAFRIMEESSKVSGHCQIAQSSMETATSLSAEK